MNNRDLYPFQHSPFDEEMPKGPQSLLDQMFQAARDPRAISAAHMVETITEQHKHICRIVNGMHYAVRWCVVPGCMQSWRMFVRADHPEEFPGVWVPIEEPVDLNVLVLPDYDED